MLPPLHDIDKHDSLKDKQLSYMSFMGEAVNW